MINIYKIINDSLIFEGYYAAPNLYMNNKEIKMTKEEVYKQFDSKDWKCVEYDLL